MNKLIYLSCVLLLITVKLTHAQERFTGIGPYKIGEYSIEQLLTFAKESKLKIKVVSNRTEEAKIKTTKKYFVELLPNSENRHSSPVNAILCDGIRVFVLSHTEVNGISITNLIFTFKESLLYDFHCDYSSELGNAIETKYGKGENKIEESAVSCGKESTIQTIWDNGNVQALVNQRKYYNSFCEAIIRSFFTIYDSNISGEVHKKRIEKEKAFDEEKKKSLSNF